MTPSPQRGFDPTQSARKQPGTPGPRALRCLHRAGSCWLPEPCVHSPDPSGTSSSISLEISNPCGSQARVPLEPVAPSFASGLFPACGPGEKGHLQQALPAF